MPILIDSGEKRAPQGRRRGVVLPLDREPFQVAIYFTREHMAAWVAGEGRVRAGGLVSVAALRCGEGGNR